MVNPFVYSFRMKIFKNALKKCWKKRVHLKPDSLRMRNTAQEFNTHL